ncbi:MAG: PDGLE domain-containing protein [Thomasclavelia ramosa]
MGAFAVVLQEVLGRDITELPFTSFVVLMLPIHLAIGLVEGLITSTVVLYVLKDKREIVDHALNDKHFGTFEYKKTGCGFAVLTILVGGVLSLYASSNPDGLEWSIEGVTGTDEIEASGSTKDTLAKARSSTSFLPDYNFSGSDSKLGVSVSGIIGGAATLILIGGIGYIVVKKKNMNKLKGSLLKFAILKVS